MTQQSDIDKSQSDGSVDVAGQRGGMLNELRRQIVEGRWAPGQRLPTRAELVEQFGVSSLTIQRAVDRLASEGFVTQQPRQGTFVAENPPHLYRYALVIAPQPEKPLTWKYSHFWAALAHEAKAFDPSGKRLFELRAGVDGRADNEGTQRLLADVEARRFAGIITTHPFALRPILGELDIPCVAFMRRAEVPGMITIEVEMQRVLVRAIEALKAAGRTRVGLIAAETTHEAVISFFQKSLARQGMTTCPAWIHGVSLSHPRWAANAVQAMMHGPESMRPDGLIVTDDHLLPHAARGLIDAGMTVPDQVSVVGYTNHGWSPEPALPVERLGFVAGDLLRLAVDLIDQQNRRGDAPLVTPVEPLCSHELPHADAASAIGADLR